MSPRAVSALLGLAVVALVLLLVASAVAPGAERWRSAMLALGAVVGVASLALMVALMRRAVADEATRSEEAESGFERQVLREVARNSEPPEQRTSPRAPVSGPSAPAPPRQGEGRGGEIEALLAQLRLARMEASVAGEVREGPLAGAVILHVRGGAALALRSLPRQEDWALLFPRHDRVFVPLGGGKWAVAERMEEVLRRGMDLPLG